MSMPQPLFVAVVASDPERLRSLTNDVAISQPGIAPRYSLVSLRPSAGNRYIGLPQLERKRVILWIAFDDDAEDKCVELHEMNEQRPAYSRGFYETHLPDPVLKASSRQEFKRLVEMVYEAFCETS